MSDKEGMTVEWAYGRREYAEVGMRVEHWKTGERGTLVAIGGNACDIEMDVTKEYRICTTLAWRLLP